MQNSSTYDDRGEVVTAVAMLKRWDTGAYDDGDDDDDISFIFVITNMKSLMLCCSASNAPG